MSEFVRLLAATLLGAGVTLATGIFFQRWQDVRERKAEAEKQGRALRRSLRLAELELLDASATIDGAREDEVWWSFPPTDLPTIAWKKIQGDLAELLDDDSAWSNIMNGFDAIEHLNQRLEMMRCGVSFAAEMDESRRNESWSKDHSGRISPPWDDTLMRTNTVVEWARRDVWSLLYPSQEFPSHHPRSSRLIEQREASRKT